MIFDSASEQAILRGIVLDAMHDGALAIDRKQTIIYVNRSVCERSGYDRDALLGEPVHMLLSDSLREIHQKHIQQFALKPQQRRMANSAELLLQHVNGSQVSVQVALGYERHPVHGLVMIATLRWL